MIKKILFGLLFLVSVNFVMAGGLETYCLERYCEPICECNNVDDCKSGTNSFWKASLRTVDIENFCAELFETGGIGDDDCSFLSGSIDVSSLDEYQAVVPCTYKYYPFDPIDCDISGNWELCRSQGCIKEGRKQARKDIHGKRIYINSDTVGQCRLTSNGDGEVSNAVREVIGGVGGASFSDCTFGELKKLSSNSGALLTSSESNPSLFLYDWNLEKVGQECTTADGGAGFCSFEMDSDGNIGVCKGIEYIADFSDSFGYFCPGCNENEKNAGTSTMQKFSALLGQDINRWTLKRIVKSNGNSYNFNYEPKTWFNSRGDNSNSYAASFSQVMAEGAGFQYNSGDEACNSFASGSTCNSISYSCASIGQTWNSYSDDCNNILVDYGNVSVQANNEIILRRIPVHDIKSGDSFTLAGSSDNSDSLIFVIPYDDENNRINGDNLHISPGSCSLDEGPNNIYLPGSSSSCTFSFNANPDSSVKFIEVIARFGGGASFTSSNNEALGSGVNDVLKVGGVVWSATNAGLVGLSSDWSVYNTGNSGIPSDTVLDLTVDDSNLLWLATTNGVASFDGSSWNVYNTENSLLPSNDILSIEFWDGKIWIGTSDGFSFFDGGLNLGQVCSGGSTQDCSMWDDDMANCGGSCSTSEVCTGSPTVACGVIYSETGGCSGSCSLDEVCEGDASITCQEAYDTVGNCVSPVCGLTGACTGTINSGCDVFYNEGYGCESGFNECSMDGSCSGSPSCPSGSFVGVCASDETHAACVNGQCVEVSGSGSDVCYDNLDCRHKFCAGDSCEWSMDNEPGIPDTCNQDDDCETSESEGPSVILPFEDALNLDFECEDCDLSFAPEGEGNGDDEIPTLGACCFPDGPEMCIFDLEVDECLGIFIEGITCDVACGQYPGTCCEEETPPQIEDNCPIGCDCSDSPSNSYTFLDPGYQGDILGYNPSDHEYVALTARQFCIEYGFDDFESYDTAWRLWPHAWYDGNNWDDTGASVFYKIEDLVCVRFASYECSGNIDCGAYSSDDCPDSCSVEGSCSGSDFTIGCEEYYAETDSCPGEYCSSSDVCVENSPDFTFSCSDVIANCAEFSDFGCSSSSICEGSDSVVDCSSFSIGDCPSFCGSSTVCEGSFYYDCSDVSVGDCEANSGFGCGLVDVFPSYLNDVTINSIEGGDVLTLGTSIGIVVYDGSSWSKYDDSEYGFETEITSASYKSGKIVAGTNKGIVYFDGSWNVYNFSNSGVPGELVQTVGLSSDKLLAGTQSDGLGIFDTTWLLYDFDNGLSGNSINSLTFDSDVVYVGSNGGYSTLSLEVEGVVSLSDVSLSRSNSRDFTDAVCSFRAECEFESSNFYHPFPEGEMACVPNYGGGLRLSSLEACNDLGVCMNSSIDYEMYDSNLGCDRTSGVIDLVPVAKSKAGRQNLMSPIIDNVGTYSNSPQPGNYREVIKPELDIRKPSHIAGPSIMGGVMYNQVGFVVTGVPGKVINKYFTTDSDGLDLPAYFDDLFIEGGFIIR